METGASGVPQYKSRRTAAIAQGVPGNHRIKGVNAFLREFLFETGARASHLHLIRRGQSGHGAVW